MKSMVWIAAAAAISLAAPASAATFVMSLLGGGAGSGSGIGNTRTYSSTVGAQTLNLTASAWTNAVNLPTPVILKSFLGSYSAGLGVTTTAEGSGGGATHTIDNQIQRDFILLKFSSAVSLTYMTVTPFLLAGERVADSDATVFYKNGATTASTGLLSSSYFPQFTSFNVAGTSAAGPRAVDGGVHFSDTWLVSAEVASSGSDAFKDSFKLGSITLTTAIPEPTSWALMLVGFGGTGAVLRRRRAGFAAA